MFITLSNLWRDRGARGRKNDRERERARERERGRRREKKRDRGALEVVVLRLAVDHISELGVLGEVDIDRLHTTREN